MKVNGKRLLADLKLLREFTDTPGEGVTRFSYGESDKKAREYIYAEAERLGCVIEEDALKNVRILLPQNLEGRGKIIIGSHVDTVKNGGWLDGIYGVVSGLEVLRILRDRHLTMNLELVIFAEEEGSNFGSTMTGSKFIVGDYDQEDLANLKNDQGLTLGEILGNPSAEEISAVKWDFSQINAMLELHIEQGPVLEREGLPLGFVDAIFGMQVIEVELTGVGNHAGATPMSDRRDALCAAAECILAAEAMIRSDGSSVATTGRIRVEPDCSNVIPEKAIFTLEIRDSDPLKISTYMERIIEQVETISRRRGIDSSIKKISSSHPLKLAPAIIGRMQNLALNEGIPHRIMDSGAVHDACMIAKYAPVGMIFVPSIGGRSHVPEENTGEKELIQGAQFLLELTAEMTKAK